MHEPIFLYVCMCTFYVAACVCESVCARVCLPQVIVHEHFTLIVISLSCVRVSQAPISQSAGRQPTPLILNLVDSKYYTSLQRNARACGLVACSRERSTSRAPVFTPSLFFYSISHLASGVKLLETESVASFW